MPEPSRRISLEVREAQGQLRGHVVELGGPVLEFEGWLGLLTVLGRLLDGPPEGGAPAPRPPNTE